VYVMWLRRSINGGLTEGEEAHLEQRITCSSKSLIHFFLDYPDAKMKLSFPKKGNNKGLARDKFLERDVFACIQPFDRVSVCQSEPIAASNTLISTREPQTFTSMQYHFCRDVFSRTEQVPIIITVLTSCCVKGAGSADCTFESWLPLAELSGCSSCHSSVLFKAGLCRNTWKCGWQTPCCGHPIERPSRSHVTYGSSHGTARRTLITERACMQGSIKHDWPVR